MADLLSLDDFFDLLGLYGSDVATWPLSPGQMESVVSFMARSATARDAVEEMRQIEADLRHDLPRAPLGLVDRILAAAGVASSSATPIYAHPRLRPRRLN